MGLIVREAMTAKLMGFPIEYILSFGLFLLLAGAW
jgi:hypothetical protein